MYVLDTNVISAIRVPGREPRVEEWVRHRSPVDLYTTSVTLGEIEQGVRRMERQDGLRGSVLREWFEGRVLPTFAARTLAYDARAARVFGRYPVPERAPEGDALIATVAEANGMIVVTRNVKHFRPLGVRVINPWGDE